MKMKNKNLRLFTILVFLAVIIVFVFYVLYKNNDSRKAETPSIPFGWELTVKDNTHCHDVRIFSHGIYEGTIEEFVNEKVYGNTMEIQYKDEPFFLDKLKNVISIDPMEPGISYVIYFKASNEIVYDLIVFDSKESPNNEKCQDINSIVPNLIELLM